MRFPRSAIILVFLLFPALAPALRAQQPPHLGYVYPAGGRQGTTLRADVGGQYLGRIAKAYVSGGGAIAKVVEVVKPLAPKEVNELREKIQKLRMGPKSAAVLKEMAEIRKKLETLKIQRANPVLADTVTLEITLAGDAEPGDRELRLAGPNGLSNPLVFQVGQLPEFREQPPDDEDDPRFEFPAPRRMEPRKKTAEPETSVTLPAVVNGRIMPGGADRFRFAARKGQRLVVAVNARRLIPYLADAVPGWFQAAVTLYDARGKELAYDDHYRFHPDPVLFYKIPASGGYVLEIKDALYRGREDFVYRVALGELPYITGIFPRGGRAGTQIDVRIDGGNLPASHRTVDLKNQPPGTISFGTENNKLTSNQIPFAVDTLPEEIEREPNDKPADAQQVALPVIVNGRIDRPGDRDVFRIQGHAKEKIVAEVIARRLDSPLDSLLELTDAAGRQLARNDDCDDLGDGLSTHHADSLISATLPTDGEYFLRLGDAQHQGGPAYSYRLRISPPRPDFALRAVPSSINARPGGSAPITVYALQKDGFSGEIAIALKDPPKGYALISARVPAGKDRVELKLTFPRFPPKEPVSLHLEGLAVIEGKEIRHPAVPADDMMQAFIYRHLVPAKNLMAAPAGPPWGWRPPPKRKP
jgi:hypothetical protein